MQCLFLLRNRIKLSRYSLFLQQVLLLLPVRLDGVLRQELHELQRLFDFHQNLINFTTFDLWASEKRKLITANDGTQKQNYECQSETNSNKNNS